MESYAKFLSIPKFEVLKNRNASKDFVENLQDRFKHLIDVSNEELEINCQYFNGVNHRLKPINTESGVLFSVEKNSKVLKKYGKIEIIVDDNDSVTLSFFYYKDIYHPTHYVISHSPVGLAIVDIIENFLWYRLLPNNKLSKTKQFHESEWSNDSVEYAKSNSMV
ncbi:MAG: hypothetical protein IPK88_16730 [Saprospiraceae bacterium]|jgi:hypothetical protein|nr:hypothetical protein [Candidatus Defluviibacterium haderslevense]